MGETLYCLGEYIRSRFGIVLEGLLLNDFAHRSNYLACILDGNLNLGNRILGSL